MRHHHEEPRPETNAAYRRVLWAVLAINASMFPVEIGAGLHAGSASLQADALDFLADAANYGISLFVVGMSWRHRAGAALAKGVWMGLFGLWVLGVAIWHLYSGTRPEAITMGAIGVVALLANAVSFRLLWAYRGGDSNMRSAWICTRTMFWGISRCCSRPPAFLGPAPVGPISSQLSQWPVLPSKALGSSSGMRRRS